MTSDETTLRAAITQLRKDDLNYSLSYHSWLSLERRYLCMTIPKVACTTLKFTLNHLEGNQTPDNWGTVHDGRGLHLNALTDDQIVEALTSPDWYRFGFVRNPYTRLFSAYKSKIGNTYERQYRWVQDEIRQARDYPVRAGARTGIVTFRDYVHWLRDTDDRKRRDGHWNVRADVLMLDLIDYTQIGRFEHLVPTLQTILYRLEAPETVLATAADVTNPTSHIPLAWAYDQDLADLVYEVYERDFVTFGYEGDSWMHDAEGT